MPANNCGWQVHYWQGKYGGLGHLYSPGGGNRGPYDHLPHALDNGRFPCWSSGRRWDADLYITFLRHYRVANHAGASPPLWALVPDVVGDADETMREWEAWAPVVRRELPGVPLAFAAQDGMTPANVPKEAEVVFIGGTDSFKSWAVEAYCAELPCVHVGRVNGARGLLRCWQAGAVSCDGTGWFRGDQAQRAALEAFLYEQAAGTLYQYGRQEDLFTTRTRRTT
jgi:hypothetical protein